MDYTKLIYRLIARKENVLVLLGEARTAIEALQRKVAELEAQLADCAPYLKEGETPAQRIKREREDNTALIGLLAKEKAKVEELEAAQRVPSGYAIVPIEPTEEMVMAGWAVEEIVTPEKTYQAMLTAAPTKENDNG